MNRGLFRFLPYENRVKSGRVLKKVHGKDPSSADSRSIFTETAIRYRAVMIRKPKAQMPVVISISGNVGEYSINSPRGEGTNPGITRPSPLSIHTPTNIATQTGLEVLPAGEAARSEALGLILS